MAAKHSGKASVTQLGLLFPPPTIKTAVFSRPGEFESLFEGFKQLKATSYVVSPKTLLDFQERHGLEQIELIVGENLTSQYKSGLEGREELVERLADLTDRNLLTIWLPPRTIHTKLYILSNGDRHRVIQTSANLTETARDASRQTNYGWHVDVETGHPFLDQVLDDFAVHKRRCKRFMEDLLELFDQRTDLSRTDLITAWLSGEAASTEANGLDAVLEEVSLRMVSPTEAAARKVFTIAIPDFPAQRRNAVKTLESMGAVISANQAQLNVGSVLYHYEQQIGLPLMRIAGNPLAVFIGLDGDVVRRTAEPSQPEDIANALTHVHRYIVTVDRGQSPDRRYAKTALYEALLYMFATPFAHLYMEAMRQRFGALDKRGPRILYLFGPTQNGKTTFMRFALRAITGAQIEPFESRQFTRAKIQGLASHGSAFPLVFDDIESTPTAKFESIIKPYWESWWRPGSVFPQLVLTSNGRTLRDAAKSRIKRIDFDVQFTPDDEDREELNQIFDTPSDLFCWFAYFYLQTLNTSNVSREDELTVARQVMLRLYKAAGVEVPDYFPQQPLEELYDPDQRAWKDLLQRLHKATLKRDGDRINVVFDEDFQAREIREYETQLPQSVKHRRRGNTLVIESPAAFEKWLGMKSGSGWLDRLRWRRN